MSFPTPSCSSSRAPSGGGHQLSWSKSQPQVEGLILPRGGMHRAGPAHPHSPTCPGQRVSGEEEEDAAFLHTNIKAAGTSQAPRPPRATTFKVENAAVPSPPQSSLLAWPCSGFLSTPRAIFALFHQKPSWHPAAAPTAPAAMTQSPALTSRLR